jgi:hypothetical protein
MVTTVDIDSITPLIFKFPSIENVWSGSDLGRFLLRKIDDRAKLNMWLIGPPSHLGHIEQKGISFLFQELNHYLSVSSPYSRRYIEYNIQGTIFGCEVQLKQLKWESQLDCWEINMITAN